MSSAKASKLTFDPINLTPNSLKRRDITQSKMMLKRIGDRGSPYLTTLVILTRL